MVKGKVKYIKEHQEKQRKWFMQELTNNCFDSAFSED